MATSNPLSCFTIKEVPSLLEALAGEVRNNLESLGSAVVLGPVQSGKTWRSFTAQVTDGRASRTFTITVEQE